MDGGQGNLPTDEGLARTIQGLATHIQANESTDDFDPGHLRGMMSHEARVARFSPETLT
jgi:hypothetical protein